MFTESDPNKRTRGGLRMVKFLTTLSVCLFLTIGAAVAASDIDRNVSSALTDITKYEEQFAGQTSVSKTTARRTLKLLTLTRQRLDSAADHSHPAWVEADERHKRLVEFLNNVITPGQTTTTAPAPEPKTPKETASKPMPSASQASKPAQPAARKQAPAKRMISQQRVRVKKLQRDIASASDTLNKAGPKPFQDARYVAKAEQRLNNFSVSLGKYNDFAGDPDVVAAGNALANYGNMIAFGKDHAAKELEVLGDVQKKLAAIEQSIRKLTAPETPSHPYQQGELKTWLIQLAKTRKAAIAIHKPLPEIKKRAWLPDTRQTVSQGGAYDLKDVDRLDRSLRGIVGKMEQDVKTFSANLALAVKHASETLPFFDAFDPTDSLQQTKHFLSEGRADEVRKSLADTELLFSEAAEYSKLLKHKDYEQRLTLLEKARKSSDLYEDNYRKAMELVRLPEAASTDSDLLEIAEETLGNPRYDYVGDIKRLVINTDKTTRSKETSQSKFDKLDISLSGDITLSGTKTTYFYEWEEFQVATAEPVKDKFFIFYTTLKKFTKGSNTTPLNRWVIASRLQGSEIPEDNIDLD